jgi:uncharacterized protein (TIGR00369 family)
MKSRIELPRFEGCFVCGNPQGNPSALQLCSYFENGIVEAEFVPRVEHSGYPGITHGGVLVSLLDEISIWAASFAADCFCVTRDLNTKFFKQAKPGERLHLSAKVTEVRKLISVEAHIVNDDNEKIATSTGRFFPTLPEEWKRWKPVTAD